jgi:hypothetical protein
MVKKPTYDDLEQRVRDLEVKLLEGKEAEKVLLHTQERYVALSEHFDELDSFARSMRNMSTRPETCRVLSSRPSSYRYIRRRGNGY